MTIPNLNTSDTFKTWFDRTNSVISEINGITIHDLKAGDGISLSSVSNVFTVSHGKVVATGVTFTGPVNFTNSVAFNVSPTIDATVIQVSPVISGITIGNVVRMSDTGLTLAKADTAENAEVLGVVVNTNASSHVIAVAGSINNNLFSKTISNILGISGGTLGIGCAYFLDPVVAGGITNVEPTTYKHVSKPVILGISGALGSIIPYRGIEIDGISAGITAELDNKIIIDVDWNHSLGFGVNPTLLQPGDPVLYYADKPETPNIITGIFGTPQNTKIAGKMNNSNNINLVIPYWLVGGGVFASPINPLLSDAFLGLLSKIILNDVANKKLILEITLPGGSFNVKTNELDPATWKPSIFLQTCPFGTPNNWSDTHGFVTDDEYVTKIGDFIKYDSNTAKIILNGGGRGVSSTSTVDQSIINASISSSADETKQPVKNYLLNGNFLIQQKRVNGHGGTAGTIRRGIDGAPGAALVMRGSFPPMYEDVITLENKRKIYSLPFDRWYLIKPEEMRGITFEYKLAKGINDSDCAPRTAVSNTAFLPEFDYKGLQIRAEYIQPAVTGYSGLKAPRLRLENIFRSPYSGLLQPMTLIFEASCAQNNYPLRVITNQYWSPVVRSRFGGRIDGPTGVSGDIYTRSHWSGTGITSTSSPVIPNVFTKNAFNGGVTLTTTTQTFTVPLLLGAYESVYNLPDGSTVPTDPIRKSHLISPNWVSVGFEFDETLQGTTLYIGKVKLVPNTVTLDTLNVNLIEEDSPIDTLIKCSKYIKRSYTWDTPLGYDGTDGNGGNGDYTITPGYKWVLPSNVIAAQTSEANPFMYPYTPFDFIESGGGPSAIIWSPITGRRNRVWVVDKQADDDTMGEGSLNLKNKPWYPADAQPIRDVASQSANVGISQLSLNEFGVAWTQENAFVEHDTVLFHWLVTNDFGLI